jgi:phosphohistidine phosphatase
MLAACSAAAHARIKLLMVATRQLFVLRHAKSSWDDSDLADHDRPLAPRGRRAVKLLAEYVRDNDIHPAQVLCSSSRRTRETLDGVGPDGERLIEPELYSASAQGWLERLRRVPEEVASVMVIGHNPALQILVLRLTGAMGSKGPGASTDGGHLSEVHNKFPTGALATLALDCGWDELGPGRARLVAFVRPKELAHGGNRR